MDKSRPFQINLYYSLHLWEILHEIFSSYWRCVVAIRKLFVNTSFHPTWMSSSRSCNWEMLSLTTSVFPPRPPTSDSWPTLTAWAATAPSLLLCCARDLFLAGSVFQTSSHHVCPDKHINTMEGWEGRNATKPRPMANIGSESRCAGGVAPPRLRAEGAQRDLFPWVHLSHWSASCITTM